MKKFDPLFRTYMHNPKNHMFLGAEIIMNNNIFGLDVRIRISLFIIDIVAGFRINKE